MCGIVGYLGKKRQINFVLTTLQYLEYRGYDSCGVAFFDKHQKIATHKIHGKIKQLKRKFSKQKIEISLAIAHTRWATHGAPTFHNAHPHSDCAKKISLVHNGIIENHEQIRNELIKKRHKFVSQTDTEVISHLLEEYNKYFPWKKAFLKTVNRLEGSFAFCCIREGEKKIYFAKKNSPLVLGINRQGYILASDTIALSTITDKAINLVDGCWGIVEEDNYSIFNFKGKKMQTIIERINIAREDVSKQRYPHFMLKEIFEQPKVLHNIVSFYIPQNNIEQLPGLQMKENFIKKLNRLFIFACGTAYHAGYVGKYILEKYSGLEVELEVSSEARYRPLRIDKDDLVIAISQSGETADTLAAVKEAKQRGAKILAICNVLGSSLTKLADNVLYTLAGPEIGVASTKAYTAQVAVMILFSLWLGNKKGTINQQEIKKFLKAIKAIPNQQKQILAKFSEKIKRVAKKYSKFGCFLFLGRGINFPSALEGALKLKEISYIPAEGYAAGEMKHGPIALIDEYRAVVCIAPYDNLYHKMIANIQEIKARKGKVFSIATRKDKELENLVDELIYLPSSSWADLSPLLVILPLQLFAYFVAKNLGCEIDQPRNLAKSVTVE